MTYIDYEHIADEDLVRLFLATQDKGYFGELYKRFSPKIYAKCLTLLKHHELAQDATQDIFVKIAFSISKFRMDAKFSTWIYSITYNFCIDAIRKSKKTPNISDIDQLNELQEMEEIYDSFLLELDIKRLSLILNEIPIDDKVILMMKYMDGTSIRELSHSFKKSESAIKMKIKRAKSKFKKIYTIKYPDIK